MDHRISKDMISSGMTPSGQRSQQDLSRSQYGSAATPSSLAEAYKKISEMKGPALPGEPNRPGTPKAPGGRPHLPGEKPTPKPGLRLAGVDLFDIIKGHLMSEGLSEEDALKRMLNMTEEEKAEISEFFGPKSVTPKDSPSGTKSVEVGKKYPARQNGRPVDVTYDKSGNKSVTPMSNARAGMMQYKYGSTWGR